MKSGVKFFLLLKVPSTQIRFHRITMIVLYPHIIFVLFSYCFLWRLFPKMYWTSLKGNALKVTTDISSSLKLSSMLCCQPLLRFWLKLVDLEENLNTSPKLLFLLKLLLLGNDYNIIHLITYLFSATSILHIITNPVF